MVDLTASEIKNISIELDELKSSISALAEKERNERILAYLSKYSNTKFTPLLLGKIFLLVNPPDEDGFSREIKISELSPYHPSFRTSNGGDWCRSNQGFLGTKYSIKRTLLSGKIHAVKLEGFNKGKTINQGIRKDIIDTISRQRCAILDVGKVEVDHKNGKKDEHYMNDPASQSLSDFQPLSKAANDAKREHCKKCKNTGKRYDAKRLGYKESFTKGDFDTDNCQGCYWYDPKKFNQEISSSFDKQV